MSDLLPLVLDDDRKPVEFLTGVLDVILMFGCILDEAGIISRANFSRTCSQALDQMRRQDAAAGSQPNIARSYPLQVLEHFFSATVIEGGRGRAGLVPIDGGRSDEPPCVA